MKLFPQDNEVVLYETGFEDDILGRSSISKQLSELVERIEDPVVLALDDKWGSGKTFFLKRWVAAHTKENSGAATTVYFDAFENDYLADPLVSIIGAVSARLPDDQGATVRKWKTVAAKLAKPVYGIALSAATFGAKQYFDELGDVVADAASGEAERAAQGLWTLEKDRRDALCDFRNLLSEITRKSEAPIVIVVDELDRCRPDYALAVLEVIKHFFSVPKVHFVLGINGKALENSVKARYGTDIDAEGYLRKFISVSFSLPRVVDQRGEVDVISQYASKLIADMGLPERAAKRCVDLLKIVAETRDVSLRDVGKLLSKVALLPDVVHEKDWPKGRIDILCALLVTSVLDLQLHSKLVSGSAKSEEFRDYLGASVVKTVEEVDGRFNPSFDFEVSVWFAILVFCCGVEEVEEVDSFPFPSEAVERWFGPYRERDRKSIARMIQNDWVEVFRM